MRTISLPNGQTQDTLTSDQPEDLLLCQPDMNQHQYAASHSSTGKTGIISYKPDFLCPQSPCLKYKYACIDLFDFLWITRSLARKAVSPVRPKSGLSLSPCTNHQDEIWTTPNTDVFLTVYSLNNKRFVRKILFVFENGAFSAPTDEFIIFTFICSLFHFFVGKIIVLNNSTNKCCWTQTQLHFSPIKMRFQIMMF